MRSYTYVLWSEQFCRKYVGMTENLERRLNEHNSGKMKSTKAFRPWKIVYFEEFETKQEARKRELYFKSAAGRKFLKIRIGPVVQRIE